MSHPPNRRRPRRLSSVLVGLALAAGCSSGSKSSSRINVTVEIDPALALSRVTVDATATGKSPISQDLALPATASTQATSLHWTIVLQDLKAALDASLTASGYGAAATPVLTYSAGAHLLPGQTVEVTLRLDSACVTVAPSCKADETCDLGACIKKPDFGAGDGGPGNDATTDGPTTDGATSDGPGPDVPGGDSSVTDGLATDQSTTDTPATTDAPATDTSRTDTPATDAVTDTPPADGPPADKTADVAPPVCTEPSTRCSPTVGSRQRCVSGQWVTEACAFACVPATGDCGGTCVPGSKQCSVTVAAQPQLCGNDGSWADIGAVCPALCTGGACTPACQNGTTTCNGKTLRTCSSVGAWMDTMTCPYVCDTTLGVTMGRCSGVCVPSSRQCSLTGVPQLCDSTGNWSNQAACSGGTPTCSGGTCVCGSPNLTCGTVCSNPASDIMNCGTCGKVCLAPPANGSAVCQGAAGCGVQCGSGHLQCGNLCCDSPPANAFESCTGATTCAVQCNTSYHGCNGSTSACYADTDVTHCGSSCLDCNQPNATAVCNGTQCANICNGMALACSGTGGKAACGTWDFESGTTEGWINTSGDFGVDVSGGQFQATTAHALIGSHSLAVGHNDTPSVSAAGGGASTFSVHLCPSGVPVSLSGKSLNYYIYLAPTTSGAFNAQFNLEFYMVVKNGQNVLDDVYLDGGYTGMVMPFPANQWLSGSSGPLTYTAVTDLEVVFQTYNQPWVGTVYFDDIRIE